MKNKHNIEYKQIINTNDNSNVVTYTNNAVRDKNGNRVYQCSFHFSPSGGWKDDKVIKDIKKHHYDSRKDMIEFLESIIYINDNMKLEETIARFMYFKYCKIDDNKQNTSEPLKQMFYYDNNKNNNNIKSNNNDKSVIIATTTKNSVIVLLYNSMDKEDVIDLEELTFSSASKVYINKFDKELFSDNFSIPYGKEAKQNNLKEQETEEQKLEIVKKIIKKNPIKLNF